MLETEHNSQYGMPLRRRGGRTPPANEFRAGTVPTFPNGGYGWVCTAASAMINAHTWGLNSSYGVFLAHYLSVEYFAGATPLEYAFIGSLSISCALMVSPIATTLTREIGARPTMLCGVVIHTACLILASLATKVFDLFFTQGILFGLGMGLLFSPAAAIVPQWFSTHRSLATSISASGSGLGGSSSRSCNTSGDD